MKEDISGDIYRRLIETFLSEHKDVVLARDIISHQEKEIEVLRGALKKIQGERGVGGCRLIASTALAYGAFKP
jgi:hypothetical protein